MTAPIVFSISLPHHSFSAGTFVNGSIILHTTNPIHLRAIRILCKGTIRARFNISDHHHHHHHHSSSSSSSSPSYHSEHHNRLVTAKQSIYHHEITVWGTPEKGIFVPGSNMNPGQYNFPFTFQLPTHAQSSYEGKYGRIRYKLRAYIDRPWKADWVTHTRFHVIHQMDPTLIISYANHRTIEANKQICCWIWDQGSLHVRLQADSTVYDQDHPSSSGLLATVYVDNWTSRSIRDIIISLQRQDTFRAEGHVVTVPLNLCQHTLTTSLPPKSHGHQFNTNLLMTNLSSAEASSISSSLLVPSILDNNIIRVEYLIKVKVSIKRACPLTLTLPVLICPSSRNNTLIIPPSMLPPPLITNPSGINSTNNYTTEEIPPPAYNDSLQITDSTSSSSSYQPTSIPLQLSSSSTTAPTTSLADTVVHIPNKLLSSSSPPPS